MSDSPHSPGSPPLQTELDGVSLHLARKKKHATGYKGVKKNGYRFKVEVTIHGKNKYITSRDTAVEAALAYAQYLKNPELFARPKKTSTPKITGTASRVKRVRGRCDSTWLSHHPSAHAARPATTHIIPPSPSA